MIKPQYIPIIKEEAERIRKKYNLDNQTVIGDYIFSILQEECILIQQPKPELPDLDGFSTEKVVKGRLETVVFINTSKNVEKQNFCAAHELGHQYQIDKLLRDKFPYDIMQPSDVEEIVNRFAAELMLPQEDFKERAVAILNGYSRVADSGQRSLTLKDALKGVIDLMNFYYVPFKAVLYRLVEVDIFAQEVCDRMLRFESESPGIVGKVLLEMGITRLGTPNHKKQISAPISHIQECLEDPAIMRYMSYGELRHYLENLGFSEEYIKDAKNLQLIETEEIHMNK